jgi:CarD family transcriptional regulator
LKTKSPKTSSAKTSKSKAAASKPTTKSTNKSAISKKTGPVARAKAQVALTSVKGEKPVAAVAALKAKGVVVEKVSVVQRIAATKIVRSEDVKLKPAKAKLSLVASTGSKIPATKISRSEPTQPGSKVITGKFGMDAAVAKPVVAVKAVVEKAPVSTLSFSEVSNFKAGDKIVYPGHGVGEIEGIRTTVLGGQEHHIYNITILDSGMKVMVPVSQASAVGLRKIIDKKAIDEVFSILKDRDFKIDTQTWNRRFREYSQKIKTGSVFEIAVVLRDLSVLSTDKELSFGEKKMLDMAESLLVSEIAIAKARPHDKVVGELRALFA